MVHYIEFNLIVYSLLTVYFFCMVIIAMLENSKSVIIAGVIGLILSMAGAVAMPFFFQG